MQEHLPRPLADIPYKEGFYVYILRCEDESLYTGWTRNLRLRFYQHVIGKGARYTRAHRPMELYYYESFADKRTAMQREYEIKQLSRTEKLNLKYRSKDA